MKETIELLEQIFELKAKMTKLEKETEELINKYDIQLAKYDTK